MVNHTKTAPAELDGDGSTDELGSLDLTGVVDSDDCVETCVSTPRTHLSATARLAYRPGRWRTHGLETQPQPGNHSKVA